jgi:HPt (histidine-containing phosphotransfer) domain-containing protein
MSKNIHIDLKHLSNIVDGDIEFEKELFKVFIDNGKLNIEKMEISIQENSDESWYACSHAFKGASAAVGAFQLAKILEECQQLTISSKQDKITILKQAKIEFNHILNLLSSKHPEILQISSNP